MIKPTDEPGSGSAAEVIVSAFQQTPVMLEAWDGPDLRVVARNAAAESLLGPIFGASGTSIWDVSWVHSSGAEESLRRVLETGQPFTSHAVPLTYHDSAGHVREIHLDLTYAPWRRNDGSIRGILITAADVTAATRQRRAAEAESRSWQERFEISRDAMTTLQSALLPPTVPVVPRLRIAARYLLAESENAAGGDWFSAYLTSSGKVALVVGDVVGRRVAASAAMGQLRAVVKERLIMGDSLTVSLEALDRYAATLADADAATVCVALLDPVTGELEYCTAGHPPPLLADDSGWRYLPSTGAGPLVSGRGFAIRRLRLPPEGLLLFYTDGLVERPGLEWTASTDQIGRVVFETWQQHRGAANERAGLQDEICERSLDVLTGDTGYSDDITVLAVQRVPVPEDLSVHLTAGPDVVVEADAALGRWMTRVGVGDDDRLRLGHALIEVITNSVEHGLAGRADGTIDVTARLEATGRALIEVRDNGHWKEPGTTSADRAPIGPVRGLGLPMVAQLVHRVQMHHDDEGTTVRLSQELRRPAPMLTRSGRHAPIEEVTGPASDLTIDADRRRPDTIHVHGPVLPATADRLQTWIATASRGGSRDLTVNLDDVSHLTSAGVRILQQAERTSRQQDHTVTFVAREHSVAHIVLRLLGVGVTSEG